MRNLMTVVFSLIILSLFSQNPIVKEEYFEQRGDQWEKVYIVERAFTPQGILTNEKNLYYENAISDWIAQTEMWYDELGNEIRIISRYFAGRDLGFFTEEIIKTYDEKGQLLLSETYLQENKDSPKVINQRGVVEYFDDCSSLTSSYYRGGAEELLFNSKTLQFYDERCEFAINIYGYNENITVEELKAQVRVSYQTLRNGEEERIVEQITCPETFSCDDWVIKERKIFDQSGRLIRQESGSIRDFFRQITSIDYQSDKTIHTIENLTRANNVPTQTLLSRDVNTYDLEGKILSRKRFEPLSFDETKFIYDDKGLLRQRTYERVTKDSLGLNTFNNSTDYEYQLFCDDLPAEQIVHYTADAKSRTTYSYLYPADCGEKTPITTLNIYPNPTSNSISFESAAFVTGVFDLEIFDMTGRKVRTYTNLRSEAQTLDVGDLPNGVYQLSINQEKERVTRQFVVLR